MQRENNPNYYKRKALSENAVLTLHRCGTEQIQEFRVLSVLGSGGSMISYKVQFESADMRTYLYVLKELYPLPRGEEDGIRRGDDAHLQIDFYEAATSHKGYYQFCKERYRKAYDLQLQMSSGMDGNSVLNLTTSMPLGLYEDRQSSQNGNYALYALFQYTIGHVYDKADDENLEALLEIQQKIATVVEAYHQKGFLWLDIKEKNVYIAGSGAVRNVMLFDFDSLVSMQDLLNYKCEKGNASQCILSFSPTSEELLLPQELEVLMEYMNRPSFMLDKQKLEEKMHMLGRFGTYSDTFLLGSLLFKRLFGYAPDQEDCFCLQERTSLSESPYLDGYSASVKEKLHSILKKILNYDSMSERYCYAEQYRKDLEALLRMVRKESIKEAHHFRMMQHYLSEYPMDAAVPQESDSIDILLLGFRNYGKQFLDIAMQTLQIPEKQLHIHVLTESDQEKQQYLANRPALSDFFDFQEQSPDSYGSLTFQNASFSIHNTNFFNRLPLQYAPHYIWVDMGSDTENMQAATIVQNLFPGSRIGFAWEGKRPSETIPSNILPMYQKRNIRKTQRYAEMERMAFNVHLIWQKHLNIDFAAVKKEFRDPYHYHSCISNVLAMQYRLYAVGIHMYAQKPEITAKQFVQYLEEHPDMRDAWICAEHRRWVTEKICKGYTRMDDLEICAGGKTRDSRYKTHICLLKSRPSQPLSDWKHQKWDTASDEELAVLDDLDRMSVRLHRMYMTHARLARQENLLSGEHITFLQNHIGYDNDVIRCFQEWLLCAKEILNENTGQVYRYSGLKKSLLQSIRNSEMDTRMKQSLEREIEVFDTRFCPVYASQLYYDYKNEDIKLIDRIPFILNYSEYVYLAVPYRAGTPDTPFAFDNIASATVLNPAKILYLCYCANAREWEQLRQALPYLINYIKQKKLKASIEFLIGFPQNAVPGKSEMLLQEYRLRSRGTVEKLDLYPAETMDAFADIIRSCLKKKQRGKRNLILEQNQTTLSAAMQEKQLFGQFHSFVFQPSIMQFEEIHDCEIVKSIAEKPWLTVSDIASMAVWNGSTGEQPEFFTSYQELWELYTTDTEAWNYLCKILREYAEEHDRMISFQKEETSSLTEKIHRYVIPFACEAVISDVVCAWKKMGICGENSRIHSLTSDSCEVVLEELCTQREKIDAFFAMQCFSDRNRVTCLTDPASHTVHVLYDSWLVQDVVCDKEHMEVCRRILERFREKGYIVNLQIVGRHVGFSYAVASIKQLITDEKRMISVYVYHKARELQKFHDVRSRYTVSAAKQEILFDLVLTRGFSSLFVKVVGDVQDALCKELSEWVQRCSIHARVVLISAKAVRIQNLTGSVTVIPALQEDIAAALLHLL